MGFDAFAGFRMAGHVAIVTGGAQNIGAAIARSSRALAQGDDRRSRRRQGRCDGRRIAAPTRERLPSARPAT